MITLELGSRYYSLKSKLEYVLKVFQAIYTVSAEVRITYGRSRDDALEVRPGAALEFFQEENPVPDQIVWVQWKERRIPLFLVEAPVASPVENRDGRISVPDLLGSAFYVLSCWQEWKEDTRDDLGRFLSEQSILRQLKILRIPVVNYYFDMLAEAIERHTGVTPENIPEDHTFSGVITHDIDQCKTGWRENSYQALLGGHPIEAFGTLWQRMVGRDVWFNFHEMLEIEEREGVTAAYYFIPVKGRWGRHHNADYHLHSSEIRSVINSIRKHGHEIGLHGSLGAGWVDSALQKEIEAFPVDISGGRFHFLAMDIRRSFSLVSQSDLQYDTSLGFPDQIGFRGGICHPFTPYDVESDHPFDFVEIPLVAMDRTLASDDHMALTPKEALTELYSLLDETIKFNGVFVLLWHNKFFSGYKYREWRPVFERIISEIRRRGGCFVTPSTFVRARQYLRDCE